MTIGITGGSGNLGRLVTEHVGHSVPHDQVVVTTRDPQRLSNLAGRGFDVRRADFEDAASLLSAFDGVDSLLIVSTDADRVPGLRVAQHRAAVAAAAKAGVGHLVYTSVSRAEPGNPLALVPDHATTEGFLRDSGCRWTVLRNNLYADGIPRLLAQALATGRYETNSGDGGMAFVARDDCARVAAAVLLREPASPEGTVLEVSGPGAINAEQLVALVEEVTGQVLEVVHLDDEEYIVRLTVAGFPAPVATVFASFGRATRLGWLNTVSDTVRSLTGRDPVPVRAVLQQSLG
jgi:NAD(P)H dehydrogenase (quinone)